jgi:hypothetical protein
MENKVEKALENFVEIPKTNEELEEEMKVKKSKEKLIKSDFTIIERLDKIIIAENGKQLLREVY